MSPLSSQSKHLRTLLKKSWIVAYIIAWKTYRTDVCLFAGTYTIFLIGKRKSTELFSLSLDGQTQTVEIFRYTHTKSATSFLSRSIDRNWRKATCPYCKSWIFYMRSKLYTSLFTLSIRRSSTSTTKAEWQVPFLLSAVRFLARQHTECPALGIVNLKTS